ncbi:4-hydroxy-tetrahydrodipicolinate synthase [Candidatus Pantoea symbiotica]|uniref:4-hydroxy-tetrahydrodipicolinate synthase n=1 Tax=Candidatus Pantoea symbiotica TaxID=1884370 RepID=A0A1I3YV23_9GAMM|nr:MULTISPECIES: dihydrodipicolinate synthase family protein [Pantoea]MRT26913.1 dihydrodipicolinate synthase family protein [Enterobacteriaceae bacterium RIT697]SFK35219.1 4-hydroxy-tetrahydrodipicolinate synthase [Pantoea symbiotica]SFU87374.1 4-hydroxy-tetrahydrodipicolinate synthase [Pantoea sp. YR525]
MFKGLSAFPLTPLNASGIDEKAFLNILARLTAAKVDSLGVLGSTGSYAYFTREQRKRIATLAVQHADAIPVMVSIGAVSTVEVLRLAEDAQQAGASALLLPAVSYQKLTDDEVFGLYQDVTRHVSLPVCIYDNPGTSHFVFSDALHARIATLPHIASIKIPGVPADTAAAAQRVKALRDQLPKDVTIGVSGDAFAAVGLIAGCEVWYSVCGGLFPCTAKAMTDAAMAGDFAAVAEQGQRLAPLWALFNQHGGSIRVIAAAASALGLAEYDCLPRPLRSLSAADVAEVKRVITELELA